MSSLLHAKAWRLQEHRGMIQRERRTAREICELLRAAQQFAPPQEMEYLNQIIRRADRIERYFYEMNDLVDQMYTEFGILSRQIGGMLEDNTHWFDRFAK